MKVILLQDVAKLGRKFDIVTVSDGYGLNKLVPQRLAEAATVENVKKIQAQKSQIESTRAMSDAAFSELLNSLNDKVIDVKVEASEEGKLYQALKVSEVVAGVFEAESVTLAPEHVIIKTPIKTVGEHEVELHSGDNTGKLTVNVIAK